MHILTMHRLHSKFIRLDRRHKQAITRPPPHDETAQPHRLTKKVGSLLIWLDQEMTWLGSRDGSRGRPAVFKDAAI